MGGPTGLKKEEKKKKRGEKYLGILADLIDCVYRIVACRTHNADLW